MRCAATLGRSSQTGRAAGRPRPWTTPCPAGRGVKVDATCEVQPPVRSSPCRGQARHAPWTGSGRAPPSTAWRTGRPCAPGSSGRSARRGKREGREGGQRDHRPPARRKGSRVPPHLVPDRAELVETLEQQRVLLLRPAALLEVGRKRVEVALAAVLAGCSEARGEGRASANGSSRREGRPARHHAFGGRRKGLGWTGQGTGEDGP